MKRSLLMLASMFGFFGVALGAFGAHGLKQLIPPEALTVFETGVRYHMYHAFAILLAAMLAEKEPKMAVAGRLFGLGILLFSGSLYILAVTGIRSFGMITPFGGVSFLAGWAFFFTAAFKMQKGD